MTEVRIPAATEWYYKLLGEEFGPILSAELRSKAQSGEIAVDTLIRRSTDRNWFTAETVKGLFSALPTTGDLTHNAVADGAAASTNPDKVPVQGDCTITH